MLLLYGTLRNLNFISLATDFGLLCWCCVGEHAEQTLQRTRGVPRYHSVRPSPLNLGFDAIDNTNSIVIIRNMKYLLKIVVILIIITFSATEVEGCTACVTAMMDKILPPIFTWCLIAISWFLLSSLISSIYKVKIFYVPKFIGAIGVIIVCMVLAGAFPGPLTILPLAITPAMAFFSSFAKTNKGNWKNNPYYSIQILGFAATIAITLTSYQTYQIYQNRTVAQYIVQWPGTGISSGMLKQLKEKEPATLADYRYILEHGRGYQLIFVAERIAIIGDLENDSKILEKTIERLEKTSDADLTPQIKKSLQDLQLRDKQK